MDLEQRIAQFEHMAQADPTNEMAHFSLGSAYAQAGRHADAAASFERCIAASPEMSKAYQLGAASLIESGQRDEALAMLRQGYEVATMKGDLMPKRAMAALFETLGEAPPDVSDAPPEERIPEGSFICRQSGRPGTQMEEPPFRGPVGAWIRENICRETWADWIGQGTKVINELRLDLSREEDAATYDRYMYEYLGLTDEMLARLRG